MDLTSMFGGGMPSMDMFGGGSGGGMNFLSGFGGSGGGEGGGMPGMDMFGGGEGGGGMGDSLPILSGLGFGSKSSKEAIYGKKPVVPDFPDLADSQKAAIKSNADIFPEAMNIAAGINRFNQSQILEMLRNAMPGYDAITNQASANILSGLRGELPKDVQDMLQNKSQARAMSGGFGQSGMGRNLGLRDLGMAALETTARSLDSAGRWIMQQRQVAAPEAFDVSNMFISPAQRFAADQGKFERDMHAANIFAAPDPVTRGVYDSQMAIIGMALSAYSGGAGYQGTYKPNYGLASGGGGGGWGGGGFKSYGGVGDYESNDVGSWQGGGGGGGLGGLMAFV